MGGKVPPKGQAMVDLLVSAFACDLTRVGTMQWGDSEAKFLLGFLNDTNGKPLVDHHHGYQHDRGFQPAALELFTIGTPRISCTCSRRWTRIQEGNGLSLLDNSLIFWVSEIQKPDSHDQHNMPFVLAGKPAGKLANRTLAPGQVTAPQQPAGVHSQHLRNRPEDVRSPRLLHRAARWLVLTVLPQP